MPKVSVLPWPQNACTITDSDSAGILSINYAGDGTYLFIQSEALKNARNKTVNQIKDIMATLTNNFL